MSLTLAQLRTEVRAILNEATAIFYTDGQIDQWLQHGARDISMKTRCFETDATIAVVNATLTYAEPTGCLYVLGVLNAATGLALAKSAPWKMGHMIDTASSAVPLYWFHFNEKIWLTPLASGSSTLTVLYAQTTETVTDIPDQFRWMLIDYAASRGMLRNQKTIESLALANIYNNNVQFVRRDVMERGVDTIDDLTIPDTSVMPARAG